MFLIGYPKIYSIAGATSQVFHINIAWCYLSYYNSW